jgi:signal transduction histidine kinase
VLFISSEREGGYCLIKIRDNGMGVDKESLGNIFEPLFSTKEEATGMGLTVCRVIVENHDGNITVNSTKGEETEVIIKLNEQPKHEKI